MTSTNHPLDGLSRSERRMLGLKLLGRCLRTVVIIGLVYSQLPLGAWGRGSVILRLVVGLGLLAAIVGWQVSEIAAADRPRLRAMEGVLTALAVLIVSFAYCYACLSNANPDAFNQPVDRGAAVYFATTVLSTVGFGDIAPLTAPARIVTTIQMLLDLVVLGVLVRTLFDAAQHGMMSREAATDDGSEHVSEEDAEVSG